MLYDNADKIKVRSETQAQSELRSENKSDNLARVYDRAKLLRLMPKLALRWQVLRLKQKLPSPVQCQQGQGS